MFNFFRHAYLTMELLKRCNKYVISKENVIHLSMIHNLGGQGEQLTSEKSLKPYNGHVHKKKKT